jgi:hypothetical protein
VFELARTHFHLIGQPKKKAARALHLWLFFCDYGEGGAFYCAAEGRVGWVFFFFSNRFGYFGSLMLSGAIRLALLPVGVFFGRTAARISSSTAGGLLAKTHSGSLRGEGSLPKQKTDGAPTR